MKSENLDNWAISQEMFDWIRKNIPKGGTILEFGSGTGTIELTKHYKIFSVEQSKEWVGKAPLSTYIYAPIKDGWYDIDIVFNEIPQHYDLIIVDGPGGSHYRPGIDKYWDKLKTDIPLLFDDTHRAPDRNHAILVAKQLGKEYEEIRGWQKSFIVLK